MSYKYHVGVDFHKKYSYIAVKDSKGKTLKEGQVQNTEKCVGNFLKQFPAKDTHGVVEACRNWIVMHDWLEDMIDDVVLAHPLKVKAIAEAKIKTDKIDANILSDLLRADLIPVAHVSSPEARTMKTALRQRMFFIKVRTMVKNRIHTVFDRYPEEVRKLKAETDLFGKEGRQNLEKIKVSKDDRILIDRELEFIDCINVFIKESEATAEKYSKNNGNVTRLQTIPGIGKFFAKLIDAEIDDISRFRNHKKLAAYAGLVPSTYSSGGKTFNGRITKQGNKYLRWAFVEAVIPAIRSNEELKEEYLRLKKKMNYNKVKVAIARKLLTIAFKILKEKRNFKILNKNERELKQVSRLS